MVTVTEIKIAIPFNVDLQCQYRLCRWMLSYYTRVRRPHFDRPRQQWSLLNRFRTEQGHCGHSAVPAEGNGDLQTLIYVLVARPTRCPTLSNHVPWQNWMAAYLVYTLWMKTLFRGWPVHDTHTRRRRDREYDDAWVIWAGMLKHQHLFVLNAFEFRDN